MTANAGSMDHVLRIVVGLILIALALTGVIGWWGYIGILPLVTGVFLFCPATPLLGINTCGKPKV